MSIKRFRRDLFRTAAQLNQAYGFLPAAADDRRTIYSTANTDCPDQVAEPVPPFAVTGDFTSIARNHCCATMLTNFILQGYAGRGAASRIHCHTPQDLFIRIHQYVGNGPVFRLGGANRFLRESGIGGRFIRIRKTRLYEIVSHGNPAALLVAASPFDWHWVLAVGLSSGQPAARIAGTPPLSDLRIRIINNWDRNVLKEYIPGTGARLISVWVYQR